LRLAGQPARAVAVQVSGEQAGLLPLRLQQVQVWKHGDEFIRIVHLEHLAVGYKVVKNLQTGEGTQHHTS
jgi:hypothetical protein